jgi:riboflavin kinase/FMN adenylyltransferase
MRVVDSFADVPDRTRDLALAIGVFDGVHRGHQAVIGRARAAAHELGGAAVVLTFDPHPIRVLAPDKAPPLLTSTPHKLRLIEALGVATCVVLRFDEPFAHTPPADFIAAVVQGLPGLRRICVGSRFRFGHHRAGDVALIRALACRYGYQAEEIPSVMAGEEMISSTAIRRHVQSGRLDRAAAMLGRPFSVLGTVTRGDQLGRQLGYPTANIVPTNEVLPPPGVYAVRVLVAGQWLPGMANLGTRPTVPATAPEPRLEVHLFDFNADLYRAEVEIAFITPLRPEQKFASLADLRAQLARDEQSARDILRKLPD